MIGDKIYNILFTLDVIDRLQTDTQMPMTEILEWALNKKTMEIAVKCLLKYLIGVDVEIDNLDEISKILLAIFIEQARSKKYKDKPHKQAGKLTL